MRDSGTNRRFEWWVNKERFFLKKIIENNLFFQKIGTARSIILVHNIEWHGENTIAMDVAMVASTHALWQQQPASKWFFKSIWQRTLAPTHALHNAYDGTVPVKHRHPPIKPCIKASVARASLSKAPHSGLTMRRSTTTLLLSLSSLLLIIHRHQVFIMIFKLFLFCKQKEKEN